MLSNPSDLNLLAQLADQFLDLLPHQQAGWIAHTRQRYPHLAPALQVMLTQSETKSTLPHMSLTLQTDELQEFFEFKATDQVGPYVLLNQIGQGGMGVVWLAQQADGQLTRQVALKLPLRRLDLDFDQRGQRLRFLRERHILASLDHPGIAKLFDAGITNDGQPYMAMQYVSGQDLLSYCNHHRLGATARIMLFIELLTAVQHAHAALVVHRDIKPSNIVVTADRRVVLLDFGVAKLLMPDGGTDNPSSVAGALTEFAPPAISLDYAAPEQITNQTVDTRSDIYSLGVVLYELLTNHRPYRFQRRSRAAMEEAILEQEVLAPSRHIAPSAPESMKLTRRALGRMLAGDLDAIIQKALAKSREARYQTVSEFNADLVHWLNKEPVSAQPDRIGYRMRRLLRKHWKLIGITSFVMFTLILTTLLALMQTIAANRSNQAAQRSSAVAIAEAKRAKAVTAFMKDLFNQNSLGQANPILERNKTAGQLLDDGAKRIKNEMGETPELQIEMMHMIADLYAQLGLAEQSEELDAEAVTVAKKSYGDADPRTLSEIARLSEAYFAYNNPDLGNKNLVLVHSALGALANSSNIDQLRAAGHIYTALLAKNVFDNVSEALPQARQTQLLYKKLPESDYLSDVHHIIAVALLKNFEFDEAEREFNESLRTLPSLHGGQNFDGSHYTWYGIELYLTGHYGQAERNYQQGYLLERHRDSSNHPVETWNLAKYVKFLFETGRAKEALALTETGGPETTGYLRQHLDHSFRTLWVRSQSLIRLGRVEQALKLLGPADALAAKAWGKEFTWVLPEERMEAELELGRIADEKKLLERARTDLEKIHAIQKFDARQYWLDLVQLLLAQKRSEEARSALNEARPVLAPAGAGLIDLAKVCWLEVKLLQQTNHHDLAKHQMESMLATITNSPDRRYLREWEARLEEAHGVTLAALGEREHAKAAYEDALAIYRDIFDPATSLSIGRTAFRMAELARQCKDASQARAMQKLADLIKSRHPMFAQWLLD